MSGMMKVTLIGRLGQDPELRDVGQTKVCSVSVAVSEKWKGKDGSDNEKTSWFRAEMWGARGEAFAKWHNKGDMCAISGNGVIDEYEDKNGNNVKSFKVKGIDFTFLPNKKGANSGNAGGGGNGETGGGGGGSGGDGFGDIEDDIPF